MDDLQRMLIERECERLVVQYCHHLDHHEPAAAAELFTDQCVWSAPGHRMVGRAEVAAGLAGAGSPDLRSRLVCNNFLCDVASPDRATGVTYMTLYRRRVAGDTVPEIDGPTLVGEYRDRFVRTASGWRIAERSFVPTFVRGVS